MDTDFSISGPSSSDTSPVEIAFGCDTGYLQPLTVCVASILSTARHPARLRFWLITASVDDEAFKPLRAMVESAHAKLETRSPCRSTAVDLLPLGEHFTEATYYRLMLPKLLPSNVSKLIYLDSDVIVRRPVEELWQVNLGQHSTAAVFNPRASNFQQLGLRREQDYFNAGVLLMDLDRWRKEQIHERALQFALNFPGPLPCADQDALNHVLAGNWKRLDLRWNQQSKFFQHSAAYLRVSPLALWRARSAPYIVHYSTSTKPWHATNDHPWRDLYFEQLDRTHHRGWRPPSFAERASRRHRRMEQLQQKCHRSAHALKSLVLRGLRSHR